jgi:chromosomal replication initiator protein
MDPDAFQRWISPLRFVANGDTEIVLECPNAFFKDWVERHHHNRIAQAFRQVTGSETPFRFQLQAQGHSRLPRKAAVQMSFAEVSPSPLWNSGLNGNYTFDRFVVGPCNEFAYTASLEVARSRKTRYNPLLLLADVGLGKSHLSCAIGNHILQHGPQERVYYTTAEGFVNEMVRGIKAKQLESFKDKFRQQCDVLVLDGVDFLSGKTKTQTELAHTLDALSHSQKRIVLTSNLSPREIVEMDESLKSRITSGLVVDIKPPDLATRRRILEEKARREEVQLPDDVTEYLARRITGNVRQLESGLIHLMAKASLLRRPIDLELAREVARDLFHDLSLPKKPALEEIMDCVCRYFKLDRELFLSRSRKKAVYHPRHVAMYLCRQHTDATLTAIGRAFRRDHASVIHSLAVIQKKCVTDSTTRNQVGFLAEEILKGR